MNGPVGRPMSSLDGLVDRLMIGLGGQFGSPVFRDGVTSAALEDHLRSTSVDLGPLSDTGSVPVTVDALTSLPPASVTVASEVKPRRPTVIYHHGLGEIRSRTSFERIVRPARPTLDANLIAVRAPFHDSIGSFLEGLATLERVIAMQAASVSVIEAACQQLHERRSGPIVVAGTSLGGFVTNLHHIHHGTADRYVPMLAGVAEHDVFLNSPLSHQVHEAARDRPEYLADRLDFSSAFAETDPGGVHPILAEHDRIVRYEVQYEAYAGRPIQTIDAGHLVGATMARRLHRHLEKVVDQTRTGSRTPRVTGPRHRPRLPRAPLDTDFGS